MEISQTSARATGGNINALKQHMLRVFCRGQFQQRPSIGKVALTKCLIVSQDGSLHDGAKCPNTDGYWSSGVDRATRRNDLEALGLI